MVVRMIYESDGLGIKTLLFGRKTAIQYSRLSHSTQEPSGRVDTCVQLFLIWGKYDKSLGVKYLV
jgi:hypothetical protein